MKSRFFQFISALLFLSILLGACAPKTGTPLPAPTEQPYQVQGKYSVTNDFVLSTYIVENSVGLADMHGFVIRDLEWERPVDSQTLGFMTYDAKTLSGTFDLNLPVRPEGIFNDVNHDGKDDKGVQIFAMEYFGNLSGGPFSEGDDRSMGWPSYLASVVTDAEKKDEVIGGKLIVWSPDANQQFPTGFGADGLLFTDDDPVAAVPAGYSLVDLDKQPFAVSQTPTFDMTLNEPKDYALKDFSKLSYTEAFDKTFEYIKLNYAFNGIEGKQPDWDKVYKELKPRVETAEKNKDAMAFYKVMRDFTWAFKDGHVGISGDLSDKDFQEYISGGYGFSIRELDDGRAVVIFITDKGPAALAGMQVGAEVTAFDGKPIADAISSGMGYGTQSSDFAIRYQKARYFLRTLPGQKADVTFTNPAGQPQTVTLTAIAETDSFSRTSVYYGVENQLLPVTYKVINEGNASVGYIAVNSYYDDLNLIIRLFERALKQFTEMKVSGIIIDMRDNGGGNPLGLAGFLYDKEIPLGQAESFSEATGKFEPDGIREKIYPNINQYRFDKMVLLVGMACASACDQEAYSFSKVPGMIVVGQYPTAGIFADVAKGMFSLPEGISMQVPTTRFTLPDGSLFLEGQGVKPTIKVPVDETTVFAENDVVLDAGIKAVLEPEGAGLKPSGPPKITAPADVMSVLSSTKALDELAREKYADADLSKPGILKYTIALSKSQDLLWPYFWCTTTKEILDQNFKNIQLKFKLDGKEIPLTDFATLDTDNNGQQCRIYAVVLNEWTAGEHHLSTTATFTQAINDGMADYKAGAYVQDYTVYVKP